MKLTTLNNKILILVTSLLCLTSFIIIFFVWLATSKHAENQLERELDVAEEIFKRIFKSREDQLYNSALVLTDDFGFKQSIATKDKNTIASVLKNHSERISADLMTAIDLDGNIISSTSSSFMSKKVFPDMELLKAAIKDGGAISFLQFDQTLYQVILLTVDAPETIAIAQLGFEVDEELISNLKDLTKLDIIVQSSKTDKAPLFISSLSKTDTQKISSTNDNSMDIDLSSIIQQDHFISKKFSLLEAKDLSISILLAENIDRLFSEFNNLQYKIIITTMIAVTISLLVVAIFSKNLTLPLSLLAKKTHRIADGQYDNQINIKANSREIGELLSSFKTMQTKIHNREAKILYQSNHDRLTGLLNRFGIQEIIKKRSDSTDFSIIGIRVNDYRSINDTFGYASGDEYIKTLSERVLKITNIAAKISTNEMLLFISGCVDKNTEESIQQTLEQDVLINGIEIRPSLAFGLILCGNNNTQENLFRRITMTLDKATSAPNGMIHYSHSIEDEYLTRLNILNLLKNALHHSPDEFSMAYQPKLHIDSNTISKAEALLRWNNPTIGFVSPEVFIPMAEQAGLIQMITKLVIKKVFLQIQQWQQKGAHYQVAINLSVHDIKNSELLSFINDQLSEHNITTSCVSFEITESDLMDDPKQAAKTLCEYRNAGFSLSIDDFGTGHSSLSYLKSMPINELKIDKSFILKLDKNPEDQNIVQTIISLAKMFDLEIVAEGVENNESLELLSTWGCTWIQGYYISKPLPADELWDFLQQEEKQYG